MTVYIYDAGEYLYLVIVLRHKGNINVFRVLKCDKLVRIDNYGLKNIYCIEVNPYAEDIRVYVNNAVSKEKMRGIDAWF